jgi:uncharacterized protein (TIGR01777 family)
VRVAITGSHGLIGSALVTHLLGQGDEVIRVVRGVPDDGEIGSDPAAGTVDPASWRGIDAVVNLAGAGIGDHRWSPAYKEAIRQSRVRRTEALASSMAQAVDPPSVLLSGSAVGYYGPAADAEQTEESPSGSGFLADVCASWERATAAAGTAGIRVVHLRMGIVLSASGGALGKQLPLFRLGLGARLGRGHQVMSWICRPDAVRAVRFLLAQDTISGPVNVTAPAPVSNSEFVRALGRALHRPAWIAVPSAVIRLAAGSEMAGEFFLASQNVVPDRLTASGFVFEEKTIDGGVRVALGDQTTASA